MFASSFHVRFVSSFHVGVSIHSALSPAGGSGTIKPDTALGGCLTGSFPVALDGLQEKGFLFLSGQKF